MPRADYQLIKLLSLGPSVQRLMTYQQGCFAGGTMIRLAKDLAENNKGARILVVCVESSAIGFRGPSKSNVDNLVAQALFGDEAAAIIIGSDPKPSVEMPVFEIVSVAQSFVPNGDCHLALHLCGMDLTFHCTKGVPPTIAKNVRELLNKGIGAFGNFKLELTSLDSSPRRECNCGSSGKRIGPRAQEVTGHEEYSS
ncbi:hypothetical protein RND71_004867 [Anisodus tanguticus]|uniref:chalcone synthase n=1 Tax=Anisodus tanguticus TaxID=243964 RepID=A0AAE1SQC7_9SOLA|nr:hypothetical protein RND71_004867 [Anisodus tanguticus]